MKILSAAQLYEADQVTIKKGAMSSADLMERAATLCFQWIHNRLQGSSVQIRVFCGTGNNGGDGLVIARHLKQHGYNVSTHVVNCSNKRSKDFLTNYERLKEIGVWPDMITCKTELPDLNENDMIIDAIFGLGLTRPPEGVLKEVIQHINAANAYVLAVDVPSGMYAEKSIEDRDAVVRAYHALTFQTPKLAFLVPENEEFLMTYSVIDIGLDAEFIFNTKAAAYTVEKYDVLPMYKPRNAFAHKGSFGHACIVGGSYGKIGAVALASRAALSIGSGLVTAYTPECGYDILQTSIPELMVATNGNKEVESIALEFEPNVIGIGVGLGTAESTFTAFKKFLKQNKKPLVIDADAINLLAKDQKLLTLIPEGSVLTPHIKEFERLNGPSNDDFERLTAVRELAQKLNSIVIFKGRNTAIAFGDTLFFNQTGNPGLATGGTGDVLTGLITGLMAQGYTAFEAAVFGVYLHGLSADVAMADLTYETFIASNCIDYLPEAFKELFKRETPPQQQAQNEGSNQQTN